MKKIFALAVIIVVFSSTLFGAITTNINSGNPSVPFPRFWGAYEAGAQPDLYTLDHFDHQPDGVTHAEMEQWGRDAWKIHSNRFSYSGTVNYQNATGGVAPVQMILDWNGDGILCSEGHGYHLLAAALMADKDAFDGIWFYMNEGDWFSQTPKYSTGAMVNPGYTSGLHVPGWVIAGGGADAATDGDMDIAMAALIAWKQWGDGTGYYAAGGTGPVNTNGLPEIEYKQMALDMMRYLVEIAIGDQPATNYRLTGDVGFDGYHKGGNTWGEATDWASTSTTYDPYDPYPFTSGPTSSFYDYTGPSYFRCFADTLETNGDSEDSTPFVANYTNINQHRRAAASDTWLNGQLGTNYTVPIAGRFQVAGATATFSNEIFAEDLRSPWRHALDYMLYGNPTQSWDPNTHQIVAGGNTNEYDTALKLAGFLDNHGYYHQWGTFALSAEGAAGMVVNYTLTGAEDGMHINHIYGASAPACIIRQDFEQMGDWYRQLMILWDTSGGGGDGYLTSEPRYFHAFFRTLGLVFFSGNYTDPCNWKDDISNMKIYKAVDKTYAFENDLLTYWLNYRNYAAVDATGVVITDNLPGDFEYVSSTGGGFVSGPVGNQTITWNIGGVTGLHNQNVNATVGGVTLVARVLPSASGRYCNVADITTTNGTGWTTSDQPNGISTVMQRNCVDIISAALRITKVANITQANPGDTVTYSIEYGNSSEAGWLDGGRFGVNFAFAADGGLPTASTLDAVFHVRGFHAAVEPMIDWANYRISYFVNSNTHGAGWNFDSSEEQGIQGTANFTTQDLVPGTDATGAWNQRLIIQWGIEDGVAPSYTLPTFHLLKFFGLNYMVHFPDPINGNAGKDDRPFLNTFRIGNVDSTQQDWTDDWSQLPGTAVAGRLDASIPAITDDYTDGDPTTPGVPVTKLNKDAFENADSTVNNVLIEEWDGYTWRRAFGTGPQPGRQVSNVHIVDSLPAELTWGGFITTPAPGTRTYTPGTRTIDYDLGDLLVDENGYVSYWAVITGSCFLPDTDIINHAWIYGDNESPVPDSWTVARTCDYVPPPPPPPSSVTKTASAATVSQGDNVTYTIDYTNLIGTYIDSTLDSTVLGSGADWTRESGAADFTFDGAAHNPTNTTSDMVYDYSHGVDGVIEVRATLGEAAFGIKFRDDCYFRLTPGYSWSMALYSNGATMNSASGNNGLWEDGSYDIRIVLSGGTVEVYLKDIAQAWGPTPVMTAPGMSTTPGYAGLAIGNLIDPSWQSHTVTQWKTSLDTAFDVLVRDPLPAGMTYVSAANSGSLSTTPDPDEVQWPVIPQMAAGDTFSYSWVASPDGSICDPIVNSVYVEPRGVTYTVGDQVSIDVICGATTPTFTPTFTQTSTPSVTPTNTQTSTQTSTPSVTSTNTQSATPSATPTSTETVTETIEPPTFTNTPTVTQTNTATNTATVTETTQPETMTDTPTATQTSTQTNTATNTATVTETDTSNPTFTDTPTATPSTTPSFTITETATTIVISATITSTHTSSFTPTMTQTVTGTATGTVTETITPVANTATTTETATQTITNTITITFTPTITQSATQIIVSATITFTSTQSPTETITQTVSPTTTQTASPTNSPMLTFTATATSTPSSTPTFTSTGTQSMTPTPTQSATSSITPSSSQTPTATQTFTASASHTATPTITATPSSTPTMGPTPLDVRISLKTWGDSPRVGAIVNYSITIRNYDSFDADYLEVYQDLPPNVSIIGSNFPIDYTVVTTPTGQQIRWDLGSRKLGPGDVDQITITFQIRIDSVPASGTPIEAEAHLDFNDHSSPYPGPKRTVSTGIYFYPTGQPVVFPNPFNPFTAKDNTVKFLNVVPGSVISIYTISGEIIKSIPCAETNAQWDGKNRYENDVSAGIYFFIIDNKAAKTIQRGKLFVIKQ